MTERLYGIETEYGILVEGKDAGDLMEESRLLVRAYPGVWAGPWDYRAEDPRADMRGYHVDALNYDREDARYDRPGATSHMSGAEQRSDRALVNGARLYNDHGHPEYSTPECRTLPELVAQDRAGERIVQECARLRTEQTGREVRIFKNNTDLHGMSYGCHEGYLCQRKVPFESLLFGMLPFLVTRILFAGAGKSAVEASGPLGEACVYQLSQRADFFTEIASVDTLAKRPIFNTRDEPHADPRQHRRVHVICGDANLSEFATALKVGTTALVLSLLEAGWEPLFRLRDPINAIKLVSRDPSYRWILELEDGRTLRATDIQRIYLRDAQKLLAGSDPDTDWTLREWERVLDDLEQDVNRLEDRVDWVAKRRLLETFIEAEGIWWEDPMIRSLDLEYHNLDPASGLYFALEEAGQMQRVVTDERIAQAEEIPPPDTRAALRGDLIRRFAPEIGGVSWGRIGTKSGTGLRWRELPPETPAEIARLRTRLEPAKTVSEALDALTP
jgi:proteasome accessory factor A